MDTTTSTSLSLGSTGLMEYTADDLCLRMANSLKRLQSPTNKPSMPYKRIDRGREYLGKMYGDYARDYLVDVIETNDCLKECYWSSLDDDEKDSLALVLSMVGSDCYELLEYEDAVDNLLTLESLALRHNASPRRLYWVMYVNGIVSPDFQLRADSWYRMSLSPMSIGHCTLTDQRLEDFRLFANRKHHTVFDSYYVLVNKLGRENIDKLQRYMKEHNDVDGLSDDLPFLKPLPKED